MKMSLPAKIVPMEPILCTTPPPDNHDFIYEVKWDGVRMLAFIEPGQVRLINKRQHVRTRQYPELQGLTRFIKATTAILDGEVIALKNGRPSFPTVMQRDLVVRPETVQQLVRHIPIHYMVFDLLFLNGEFLTGLPLEKRKERLYEVLQPQSAIQLVEPFSSGQLLWEATRKQDMEGIVAKRRDSPYIAGKKHRLWLKMKHRRRQNCVVGGYTLRGNRVNALLLGAYRDGELLYLGRAGSGLTEKDVDMLTVELPRLEKNDSPFHNLASPQRGYYFTEPVLTVAVEFAEWTEDGHFRAPVIAGFTGLSPRECQV